MHINIKTNLRIYITDTWSNQSIHRKSGFLKNKESTLQM